MANKANREALENLVPRANADQLEHKVAEVNEDSLASEDHQESQER
jgi:hypothetical protein